MSKKTRQVNTTFIFTFPVTEFVETMNTICVIESGPSKGWSHEYCECKDKTSSGARLEICKPACITDPLCKGYEYGLYLYISRYCLIYTTATCPSECSKKMVGKVGSSLTPKTANDYVCAIKSGGEIS